MLRRAIELLRPAPPGRPVTDPAEVARLVRYRRFRILYASLIGYAFFCVVGKNLSLAMPGMKHDLGISKEDLGLFLTLHGLLYGVSKFAKGVLGDRTHPRYFMAIGLIGAAAMLCAIGFFIHGPQCLVGVIAANLATRRAAATAVGLTGLPGYLSTPLSGWGLGRMAERSGWNPVLLTLVGSSIAAAVLFAVAWNARHNPRPSGPPQGGH